MAVVIVDGVLSGKFGVRLGAEPKTNIRETKTMADKAAAVP